MSRVAAPIRAGSREPNAGWLESCHGRLEQVDADPALPFERLDVRLFTRALARATHRQLSHEVQPRRRRRIHRGEPSRQPARHAGEVPAEVRAEARDERRLWLVAERRTGEVRALALRHRRQRQASERQHPLRGQAGDRRRHAREQRVLLVLQHHAPLSKRERVRGEQPHGAEVVVDLVVDPARQRAALDRTAARSPDGSATTIARSCRVQRRRSSRTTPGAGRTTAGAAPNTGTRPACGRSCR